MKMIYKDQEINGINNNNEVLDKIAEVESKVDTNTTNISTLQSDVSANSEAISKLLIRDLLWSQEQQETPAQTIEVDTSKYKTLLIRYKTSVNSSTIFECRVSFVNNYAYGLFQSSNSFRSRKFWWKSTSEIVIEDSVYYHPTEGVGTDNQFAIPIEIYGLYY